MMEAKLLPTDWIYDNIFDLAEDGYDEYRDLHHERGKCRFRLNRVEAEGNEMDWKHGKLNMVMAT
jgi:hypothetical protein